MTARVLESLEDKDDAAFAAACESLWGNESPSVSSPQTDAMPAPEVSAIVFDYLINHRRILLTWHAIAVIFANRITTCLFLFLPH